MLRSWGRRRRLRRIFEPPIEEDVRRELELHVALRAEELERAGWDATLARLEAERLFGDVEEVTMACVEETRRRDQALRRAGLLDGVLQDLRFGLRALRRSPGFAGLAVLTLGLGIGANTAIFSVVNGVLLRPLPLHEPERLVQLWEVTDRSDRVQVPGPNVLDWRERSGSFAALAATTGMFTETVLGGAEPARVVMRGVSRDFFRVVGVQPALGRVMTEEEFEPGRPPSVVVSHGFWQRLMGGTTDLSSLRLEAFGVTGTVVGVMPPGFEFVGPTDVFYPVDPANWPSRTAHNFQVFARLAPQVSLDRARAELHAIAVGLKEEHGDGISATSATVVPLQEQIVGESRRPLLLLLAAAGLVLLVACSNLASTLLARGSARQREIAVRAAVGAGRGRLVRQLLTESALLAGLGSVAGLVLAVVVLRVLLVLDPSTLPRMHDVGVDGRVLAFTLGVAALTALVFGLVPALQLSRESVYDDLRDGTRGTAGPSKRRLWGLLVGAEVAVALVLMVGSGLLIKSFWTVLQVDPGYDPAGVLTVQVAVPESRYPGGESLAAFHRRLLAETATLPGVEAAGLISNLPLVGWDLNGGFAIRDGSEQSGYGSYRVADAGYFGVMRIPLLRGRLFDERDRPDAPHAAVINQAMADRYWPGEDPIGRQIRPYGLDGHPSEWLTVVGVVGNVRHQELTAVVRPEMYVYFEQRPGRARTATAVLRSATPPSALASTVRDRIVALDPNVPVELAAMDTHVARSVADRRFSMAILAGFALITLILAMVGIYGVVSYAVAQRTREIGICMALGASPGRIRRALLRDSMVAVAVGVVVGAGAAWQLSGVLRHLLYEVSPTDPFIILGAVPLLVAAAVTASLIPARRTTAIDPMAAIRAD